MNDLNDLYYFAMVVEHSGFAAAERALGIPKSRLSRRISQLETDMGARLLQPSCGACGNCGPGGSERAEQVTVSAINRNFPGRGGPGQVWLGSPPTVAASAIAGELVSFAELQARYGG